MNVLAIDLDGTILDCRNRQCCLVRALALAAGMKVSTAEFWLLKRLGVSTREALVRLGAAEEAAANLARSWIRDIESDYWLQYDVVLSGAAPALHSARSAGWRLEVLTARQRPDAVFRQLVRLEIAGAVDRISVVSPGQASGEKAGALRAMNACIFIGDTESDLHAATLAGIPFLAVSTGQRAPAFLGAAGSNFVFDNLRTAIRFAANLVGE